MSAPINVAKLVMWKMTDEETQSYGEAMEFTRRLMGYKDSLSVNSAELYGDGILSETATMASKGNLDINIHNLSGEERSVVYGETIKFGTTNITSEKDIAPYMCVALMSENGDGTVNLRKWFKVKFQPNDESTEQIKNGSITYSTISLKGTYMFTDNLGLRALADDISKDENKQFFEKWFTEAEYIGEESTVANEG